MHPNRCIRIKERRPETFPSEDRAAELPKMIATQGPEGATASTTGEPAQRPSRIIPYFIVHRQIVPRE